MQGTETGIITPENGAVQVLVLYQIRLYLEGLSTEGWGGGKNGQLSYPRHPHDTLTTAGRLTCTHMVGGIWRTDGRTVHIRSSGVRPSKIRPLATTVFAASNIANRL